MELLISAYLIIGLMFSAVVWWAVFDKEYDTWHRDTYNDEPPSVGFKLWAITMAPILWPMYLYWIMG